MVSLTDVAREAGVSVAAASAVLNRSKGSVRVSVPVAERVREVAKRLHYVPNYHMRSVRRGRSDTIGLLLEVGNATADTTLADPAMTEYHHALMDGVEQVAQAAGSSMLVMRPTERSSAIDLGLQVLRQRRVDAVVFPASSSHPKVQTVLADPPDLPIVTIEPIVPTELPTVNFNEARAAELIIEHLAQLGHRRWAFMSSVLAREAALMEASRQAGLEGQTWKLDTRLEQFPAAVDRATRAVEKVLDARGELDVTALVCFNDLVAAVTLQALHQRGLRVPQDVSVVGFDNLRASWTSPRLTTVDHHLYTMGQRASEMAMEMVEGGEEAVAAMRGRVVTVEPDLVVRDSTAPAPKR